MLSIRRPSPALVIAVLALFSPTLLAPRERRVSAT